MTARISAAWLEDDGLQALLRVLGSDGEEARIAGGAVRNALFGEPVADIDIATTCLPEEVVHRAAAAGMRTVPTGVAHGTVTVISGGTAYEVTTLRKDVATDGRRALVRFGRDWKDDAERRDFTINGLYAEADGTVVDLVGGIEDIRARRLRFIGNPDDRIREDYLRILRFFRFFAWYGEGRPDAEGLKSCARHKDGLKHLSAERVWAELRRMLAAPDPGRALLWMRQTSVLSRVLPESEKWGIDAIPALLAAERRWHWQPDPLLRLMAILPPRADAVAEVATRLKLSRSEAGRLARWAQSPVADPNHDVADFRRLLYRADPEAVRDRLRLALAAAHANEPDGGGVRGCLALLQELDCWKRPRFPITGKDMAELGMAPGARMGRALRRLEDAWVAADFAWSREELLARAASEVGAG